MCLLKNHIEYYKRITNEIAKTELSYFKMNLLYLLERNSNALVLGLKIGDIHIDIIIRYNSWKKLHFNPRKK